MSPSLADAAVAVLNNLMLRQAQHEVLTLSLSKGEDLTGQGTDRA